MSEFLQRLFSGGGFMPHGHCYFWKPEIIWLHVLSDSLIALAYYSIPLTLVYFIRRRRDVPFSWMFLMFGAFIVACGTTHLMEIWSIWHSTYWLSGVVKAVTALLSVATAILLVKLVPQALLLRGPAELAHLNAGLESRVSERTDELARTNASLQAEISERKRVEGRVRQLNADLERRVKELQAVLDVLPVGVGIARDLHCRDIRTNNAFARTLGLTTDMNASKSAPAGEAPTGFRVLVEGRELLPEELPMQRAAAQGIEVRELEEEIVLADGRKLHLLAYATPLRDEANRICGSVGAFVDITERKRAEGHIRASLREKEVMLQEIHHRVKNNLQIVSSLLRLQSRNLKHPETVAAFEESCARVQSMALVHEMLYVSSSFSALDFVAYVRSLTDSLLRAYGTDPSVICLRLDMAKVQLDINQAIPCALILNELVSNSLKYAFPDGRHGEIRIRLHRDPDGTTHMVVGDNGVGLPARVNPDKTESLGLQLVNTLVRQLRGTIEVRRTDGIEYALTFIAARTYNHEVPL